MSTILTGRLIGIALTLVVALSSLAPAGSAGAADDPRYFVQTGYRVSNDAFWDFFSHRGGVRTFGYPVSRQFTLLGSRVQMFQRGVLQQHADGSVGMLNLLDPGLMPYTQINFSRFPAASESLKAATPRPDSPDYDMRIVEFVQETAPDTWNGIPVNFHTTFSTTVTCADAYPDGRCPTQLLPLLNLQLWGAPISAPAFDPANRAFVYQRFQRGILHYDAGCGCTQGILLGDYFKAILTGEHLPPDLAEAASGSPFHRQYDPSRPAGVSRPQQLPGSDLTNAFVAEQPLQGGTQPGPDRPAPLRSLDYGVSTFAWGHPTPSAAVARVEDLGFHWQKAVIPWREIEGAGKGQFTWGATDELLKAARSAGIKTLVRIDFQPAWARKDGANNGPPDNYQDYADFIRAFAQRYRAGSTRGHVEAIEVWNEPNLAREWGNQPINQQQARDYVRLLGLAYDAVKSVDPTIMVVTAGLSPTGWNDDTARPDDVYLQWLYDAGMQGKYDALGAHGPGFKAPPEVSPEQAAASPIYGGHRSFTFRRIEDLRAIMERNGDAAKQVWVLEFGWTSDEVHPAYAWHRVSEQDKADYLVRAFKYAHDHWSPWIGPMMVWNMPDPNWGPQDEMYWWGISEPDGSPRPAYLALQAARSSGRLP